MIHLPPLIHDLGVILVVASLVTLLFKRLKQPVVLGYLIAGFLVSAHVPFFPTVTDAKGIQVWAEIGVIFLLFGLGLEFSFKKLAQVGRPATFTAALEILGMLGAGYFVGQLLGWSRMDSLFLGGILSISSTTIIIRAFGELGLKGKRFVSLVFGILIVEDLFAILILVLLSTIAATQTLSGTELAYTSAKLGFFLLLWFLVGIYIIPAFLRAAQPFLNDETKLVVSLGLCFLMVILATEAGFSPALGAFVMGSILAETREGKHIEHLLVPVRDLFGAIFFVSVGMLIDPKVLYEHFGVILLITGITVIGKFLTSGIGALLSGETIRTSTQTGMSLAQIGEFSFIIATLGLTLKVTSDFLYPIAVAVSALTTFLTPYLIKNADRAATWMDRRLPDRLKNRLERYQAALSDRQYSQSTTSFLWNAYGMKLLLNSVVILAITFGSRKILLPWILQEFDHPLVAKPLLITITLLVAAPFFWGIMFGVASKNVLKSAENVARLNTLQFGSSIFRKCLAGALVIFILSEFTRSPLSFLLAFVMIVGLLYLLSKYAGPVYNLVENRFLENLDEKEKAELSKFQSIPQLAPWDAALAEFTVSPYSPLVAKSLEESALKERFGVTVALIDRGKQRILTPGKKELILPYDRFFLVGTEEQLHGARAVLEAEHTGPHGEIDSVSFGLESLRLHESSEFLGKPIRESGIREATDGLIVAVERGGKRFLSPDSSMNLQPKDLVWIVGNRTKIKDLAGKIIT